MSKRFYVVNRFGDICYFSDRRYMCMNFIYSALRYSAKVQPGLSMRGYFKIVTDVPLGALDLSENWFKRLSTGNGN